MASEAPGRSEAGGRAAPDGSDVAIRPIRPTDLPDVLAIERSSFSVPWSERAFRHLMGRQDAAVLVADAGRGRLAGYAAWWVAADAAELGDLAVHREHRRRGVGRALVRAVARAARERGVARLFLQVRAGNEAALSLYRDTGFREVGRREGYYRLPTEDAVVLARSLDREAD